ncbi:MAG: 50S ribosomal protein L28 [Candidatus Colwellbacteria bacterium]|nr:50S ribosomal protein L28 [Candidatus Colwellbacteria bacterium]
MRKCSLCGKGSVIRSQRVKVRSAYNPTPRKRKYPNLQWFRSASGERLLACTQCIKTAGKIKLKKSDLGSRKSTV